MTSILPTIRSAPAADLARTYDRRNRPFGWKPGPAGSTLVKHEKEQEALAVMLDRQSSGWSYTMIADELTEKGFVTQRGARWSSAAISHVLRGRETLPTALRAAEGSLSQDTIDAITPNLMTLAVSRKDGKVEYVKSDMSERLDDVILDEAQVAAVEKMDAEQHAFLDRARAATYDRMQFMMLDDGSGPAMLKPPMAHVMKQLTPQRYSSIGAALDSIPAGAATRQKMAIRAMVNVLIAEMIALRSQNVHLRNRLLEVTGVGADEEKAAQAALRDLKSGVLRAWGFAREEDVSVTGLPESH